jgi:hypothetical protein
MDDANTTAATATPAPRASPILAALAAWIVPGLGHLILRRWGKALIFFFTVGALAATGLALRGHIFAPTRSDPFEMLGFLADAGAGVFFFLGRIIDNGGPDVSRAAGDYGTRFFATAGVLNLLCVLDAIEVARGHRT